MSGGRGERAKLADVRTRAVGLCERERVGGVHTAAPGSDVGRLRVGGGYNILGALSGAGERMSIARVVKLFLLEIWYVHLWRRLLVCGQQLSARAILCGLTSEEIEARQCDVNLPRPVRCSGRVRRFRRSWVYEIKRAGRRRAIGFVVSAKCVK